MKQIVLSIVFREYELISMAENLVRLHQMNNLQNRPFPSWLPKEIRLPFRPDKWAACKSDNENIFLTREHGEMGTDSIKGKRMRQMMTFQ